MRFLINTFTHWNEPPRARHQLTFALAKKFQVAFIAANKIGLPGIKKVVVSDNIILVQPYFPLDVRIRYRIPLINEIYQIWLFRRIKKLFGENEVINFDFSAYLIHKFFKRVYYYCNDNFAAISSKINIWPIYKYHIFCEKNLSKKAQYSFATSPLLAENIRKYNKNTYCIPLGGPDINEFNISPNLKINGSSSINIGLVGFISHGKISSDLINNILEEIDCYVTLIGPVSSDFRDSLIQKERVILKGVKTGEELYAEVNKFDVAIAPYKTNSTDQGNIPNKLFLYLALGKPVVITEMNGLSKLDTPDKSVYRAKSLHDFPKLIIKAHEENSNELIEQRISYGKSNTWDQRANDFLSIVTTKNLN